MPACAPMSASPTVWNPRPAASWAAAVRMRSRRSGSRRRRVSGATIWSSWQPGGTVATSEPRNHWSRRGLPRERRAPRSPRGRRRHRRAVRRRLLRRARSRGHPVRRAVEHARRRGVHRRQRRRGVRRGRRRARRARHRLRGDREPGRAAAAPARLGGDLGRGDRRVRLAGAAQGVAARAWRTGARKVVFAITEPDAGSNTHRLATTATRDGDGWVLRGTKHYISGRRRGGGADGGGAQRPRGRTGRRCSRCSSCPPTPRAWSAPRCPSTSCCRTSSSCCTSTTCACPRRPWSARRARASGRCSTASTRSGSPARRSASASPATPCARAAEYAATRRVWDVPIGAHQGVAHPLAQAKIETELAALMTHKAAWLHDHGLPAGEAANMAKYAAAEAALAALDVAMQAHGGNGVASEYGLLPYWGLARLAQDRAGEPRDDPQLRRPAQPRPAPELLMTDLIHRVNVGDSLTRTAAARPDQLAVVDGDRRLDLRRAQRLGQPHRARPRRTRAGSAATRSAWPRATAPSSSPSTTPARSSASSACRSTSAGGPTRWPTCSATRGPRASPSSRSSSPRWATPLRKATGVTEVIVLPGLGAEYAAEPADRLWVTLADRAAEDTYDAHRGGRRPRPAHLPLHLGHHVVPQGRGRRATWRSTWSRCPAALDSGWSAADRFAAHDADVPHRAAQRVLHARGAWSAPPST